MSPFVPQARLLQLITTTTVPMPCFEQLSSIAVPPKAISRSYQYRKVLKPMLERRRRARINKCLDELKQLLSEKAELNAEALTKLEKADILELTVQQLRQQQRREQSHAHAYKPKQNLDMTKYWAGFQRCVFEVSDFVRKRNLILSKNFYAYVLRLHIDKCRSYHHQKYHKQISQHVWRPWQSELK